MPMFLFLVFSFLCFSFVFFFCSATIVIWILIWNVLLLICRIRYANLSNKKYQKQQRKKIQLKWRLHFVPFITHICEFCCILKYQTATVLIFFSISTPTPVHTCTEPIFFSFVFIYRTIYYCCCSFLFRCSIVNNSFIKFVYNVYCRKFLLDTHQNTIQRIPM